VALNYRRRTPTLEQDTREDTNLKTTFNLYNRSNHSVRVKVNGSYKDFAPNSLIDVFETNEQGYYKSANDLLPYGTYELEEVIAPKGYTGFNNKHNNKYILN